MNCVYMYICEFVIILENTVCELYGKNDRRETGLKVNHVYMLCKKNP